MILNYIKPIVKNPAVETAGHTHIFSLSFPQAKRACLSGRQVGNPSERFRTSRNDNNWKLQPRLQGILISNSKRGFTLLEVLVALALLSTAFVVIFQLFAADIRAVSASDDYLNASIKAESKMREILDTEDLDEGSIAETTNDGYTIDASITATEPERTENLPVKLLQINLTVRWTKDSKEKSITLKTVKVVSKQV